MFYMRILAILIHFSWFCFLVGMFTKSEVKDTKDVILILAVLFSIAINLIVIIHSTKRINELEGKKEQEEAPPEP